MRETTLILGERVYVGNCALAKSIIKHALVQAGGDWAVGRAASSGSQTTLYLTPMHAQADTVKSMIANFHAAIQHVRAAAEQFPKLDRWRALLAYICQRVVGQIGLPTPPPTFAGPG